METTWRTFITSTLFRRRPPFSLYQAFRCCHTKVAAKPKKPWRVYGQPSPLTHPHLLNPGELVPGISMEEIQQRRFRLMELISRVNVKVSSHVVVLPAAEKQFMTENIPYFFRQNSDFVYTTGCLEPGAALVLQSVPGKSLPTHKATLFVHERDRHSERWEGPRTGTVDAPGFFGVDEAFPLDHLGSFLESTAKRHPSLALWYDYLQPPNASVHKAVREWMVCGWHKALESPRPLLHQMRLIKSKAEIQLMRKACQIGAEAVSRAISATSRLSTEAQLHGTVEYECRMRGASHLAYPPVVACGPRANIIHYTDNVQQLAPGELILMDAGCEYGGQSSDITRTWPVDGTYTRHQKLLYEAVLATQLDLIQVCHNSRPSLDQLFGTMCQLLGERLKELGILPSTASREELSKSAYELCPHHVSHYLGMDVHDTSLIPRNLRLQPGMVITIEPGLYLDEGNMTIPEEFRGIGVRIEDDVLITDSGCEVLTTAAPKSVEGIERLMAEENNISYKS